MWLLNFVTYNIKGLISLIYTELLEIIKKKKGENPGRKWTKEGTSLVVQWLRLCTPNAGGPGSIPGQGSRSPMHAAMKSSHATDFPGGTVVKNPPANAGDMGSSPGPGRSHMLRSN